jgi:hypothetical protein
MNNIKTYFLTPLFFLNTYIELSANMFPDYYVLLYSNNGSVILFYGNILYSHFLACIKMFLGPILICFWMGYTKWEVNKNNLKQII